MSKELNPLVRTIADELKAITTIDVANGNGDMAGFDDVVLKHLPPSLSSDGLKEAQGFMIDVAAAQTLAFGEKSQEVMVENKELERTTLRTKLGHSAIDTSYTREKSGTTNGSEWKKQGVAKSDVIIGVGRRNSHYKDVVSYLGDEAAKVFGG